MPQPSSLLVSHFTTGGVSLLTWMNILRTLLWKTLKNDALIVSNAEGSCPFVVKRANNKARHVTHQYGRIPQGFESRRDHRDIFFKAFGVDC